MNADEALSREEEIAACLRSYDDALASGASLSRIDGPEIPPDLRTLLKDELDCLHLLDELRPRPEGAPPAAHGAIRTCDDADTRYKLTRLHAVGGVGQVWLAYDVELDREVALKELRPERADDIALQRRFLREAQITGRLQHPGIVPVYEMVRPGVSADGSSESATTEELPFYTMRFVRGRTLTEAVRDYHSEANRGPLEFIALLNAFVSVCNTIAFANARGVIHRDLKGHNVVLGDFGEVMVLDWGLAKVLRQPEVEDTDERLCLDVVSPAPDETVFGLVLGTPAFMAPEQAAGLHELIDQRTDVYGLGAILFQVLTGQPPYTGADSKETLQKARFGIVPRVLNVAPSAPPALAAICAKAMARRPEDRYPNASALAREIQHWLADEPVLAYQESMHAWLRRWARRHRLFVTVAAAITTTCFFAILGSALLVTQERAKTAALAEEKADTETQARQNTEGLLYLEQIALAERELTARNINRATQLLDDCQKELRSWEWHCLRRLLHTDPRSFKGHDSAVLTLAFSPDNQHLASASYDRTARVWDIDTGRESLCLRGHSDTICDITYTPDGGRIATAGWDHTARIWDAATGKQLLSLAGHDDHVDHVAFTCGGHFLATLCSSGVITVWNDYTGQVIRTLPRFHSQAAMAVFPDGRYVGVAEWDKGVQVRDFNTGTLLFAPAESAGYYRCLAVSKDGTLLASGDGDEARGDAGQVKVWEFPTRRLRFTLKGHFDPINALAFSPDGKRLASASQDSTVKIWDLTLGREVLTLRAPKDAVRAVAFSPDGQRLAAAGADRTITVWDASPLTQETADDEIRTMRGHLDRVFQAAFTPDGRRLASVGSDRAIRIWDPASAREVSKIGFKGDVFAAAYSPDGRWLATAPSDGPVLILNARTEKEARRLTGPRAGPIKSLAFSRDSTRLATASWDRMVRVWEVASGRLLLELKGHEEPVTSVAFSPDGRQIASGSYDKTINLWDAATGRNVRTLRGHESSVFGVAFSPDGKQLASAGNDGTVQLWALASHRAVLTLRGHAAAVCAIAFSPDGDCIATGSSDWTAQLWETASGLSVRTFRGHADRVHSVAFSPDGQLLASASFDNTVKLWKVPDRGRRIARK
jgi:WD40 repeat protein/serine/threonine protein kinase